MIPVLPVTIVMVVTKVWGGLNKSMIPDMPTIRPACPCVKFSGGKFRPLPPLLASSSYMRTNSTLWLNGNCTWPAPALFVDSRFNRRNVYTCQLRPSSCRQAPTINLQVSVLSSVVVLLFSRGPSNVANFIMPVHFNAIERVVAGRSPTYCTNKFVQPRQTKLNSPPTVVLERGVVSVVATRLCLTERVRFRARPQTMCNVCRSHQTPATFCGHPEIAPVYPLNGATVTATEPLLVTTPLASITLHNKPAKSLTCQVFEPFICW